MRWIAAGALFALSLTSGCGVAADEGSTPTIGAEQAYNQEVANVINKYELYVKSLHANRGNLSTTVPKQLRAEDTAISELEDLEPPEGMRELNTRLIANMKQDRSLSRQALTQFSEGDKRGLTDTLSEISSGLVEFDQITKSIYIQAKQAGP